MKLDDKENQGASEEPINGHREASSQKPSNDSSDVKKASGGDPEELEIKKNRKLRRFKSEELIIELSHRHEGLILAFMNYESYDLSKKDGSSTVFLGGGRPSSMIDSLNALVSYLKEKVPDLRVGQL